MKFIYPAVFRKNESGGYDAYFPDLECCEASGDTLDDAIDNANEAARNWIMVEFEEENPVFPYIQISMILKQRRAISFGISR